MNSNNDTNTGEVTLAFSLSAIERLEDPKAVFEDARNWSQSVGIIDDDTERIDRITAEFDLRQDFDIRDRDKWFVLEEICETASTPRHVYIGASDSDMRVSTLFCWEYIRVTKAADRAGWTVSETRSDPGIVTRLLASARNVIE